MLARLLSSVKGLIRRKAIEAEASEEIGFHVEMETQANVERGMAPEEARRVALRDLGGFTQAVESVRAIRTTWIDTVARDLRDALRALRRAPGHAALALASLGAALAVCIAAFSAITALMFGDVPGISNRQTLVVVLLNYERTIGARTSIAMSSLLSTRDFEVLATADTPVVRDLAAEGRSHFPVDDGHGRLRTLGGAFVSGQYFQVLGTRPVRGRLLSPEDDQPGSDPVVVVSENYWRQFLGGQDNVVGSTIMLGGRAFAIVGVAPLRFVGVLMEPSSPGNSLRDDPQLWVPLHSAPRSPRTPTQTAPWLTVVGRIGASTLAVAEASLSQAAASIEAASPAERHRASLSVRRHGTDPGDDLGRAVGGVALFMLLPLAVLCVACANIANLQLARAVQRVDELRVRLALGASRLQAMRPLIYEVAFVAFAAGTIGWFIARTVLRTLRDLSPVPLDLDVNAVACSMALVLLVTLLSGCVPAWLMLRRTGDGPLRLAADSGPLGHRGARNILVGLQVAVSVVLLFVAALAVRSLCVMAGNARTSSEVMVARPNLTDLGLSDAASRELLDTTVERLRADRRVTAAAAGDIESNRELRYWLADDDEGLRRLATAGVVSPAWFSTVGGRLVSGRPLAAGDRDVAVLSTEFAEVTGIGYRDAIGRSIRVQDAPDLRPRVVRVVGVVTNPLPSSVWPSAPAIYLPMNKGVPSATAVFVRTGQPGAVLADSRKMLSSVHPGFAWTAVFPLGMYAQLQDVPLRYLLAVFGGLGSLALLLATTGLYAMVAYVVSLRTREIGVRMALGAARHDIIGVVLGHSVRITLCGAVVGLLLAMPLAYGMRAVIVGIQPVDLPSIGGIVALFVSTAVAAAAVPARRAATVDPTIAIRAE